MFTQSRSDIFQKLVVKRKEKEQKLAEKLNSLPNSPQDGDIFLFKQGGEVALEWVVLFSHYKNDSLLLTVPADDNPMAGSTDITISEEALCGPLTLRCGQGVWIHKSDFQMTLRVGLIENWHWLRALNKAEQIFDGKLQSTVQQQENDADPEYEEWIDLVSQEQEVLQQSLHEQENECELLTIDESDIPNISVTFVSQPHTLCLNLSLLDGTALLEQTAPGTSSLHIGDELFQFEVDDDEYVCELNAQQVSYIATVLNLETPYQNWEDTMLNIQQLQVLIPNIWSKKNKSMTAAEKQIYIFVYQKMGKAERSLTSVGHELFFPRATRKDNAPTDLPDALFFKELLEK